MPLYQYLCPTCKLRFEKIGQAARSEDPAACPTCQRPAPRALGGAPRMAYQANTTGITPQNTGLTGVDSNYDRVIGQSAKAGWDVQRQRVADKRAVLRANPGLRGEDLKKMPSSGHYEPMPRPEQSLHKAAQPLASAGRKAVRKPA